MGPEEKLTLIFYLEISWIFNSDTQTQKKSCLKIINTSQSSSQRSRKLRNEVLWMTRFKISSFWSISSPIDPISRVVWISMDFLKMQTTRIDYNWPSASWIEISRFGHKPKVSWMFSWTSEDCKVDGRKKMVWNF